MEVSEAAWRAVLASIERYETGEELLEALLSDRHNESLLHPATPPASTLQLVRRRNQTAGNAPRTSSSTASSTDTVQLEKKKPRRRYPQTRPKEEIDRLRHSFEELSALLRLLKRRESRRLCGSVAQTQTNCSPATAKVWKAAAARQYQYLRDSQTMNRKLRLELQTQVNIIQNFIRLIRRARAGLPLSSAPHSLREDPTEMRSLRRRRLVAAIDRMEGELALTLHDDLFLRVVDEDFRNTQLHTDDVEILAGALLATSDAGYLAPRSQQSIADGWWERIRKGTSRVQDLHFKDVDRSGNCETVGYSIGLCTPLGSATYSGLAMSRRVERDGVGIIFLGVHELRPIENTAFPMTAIEYRMETVSLIQSVEGSEEFSQITVKTTATRPDAPLVPALSGGPAGILRRFISDTLHFLHFQLQQQLDGRLNEIRG